MNLYLVRHGQDDESVRGGWCPHGLVEEGKKQSQTLGKLLSDISFDMIFSSDLKRAVETTEIIASYLEETKEVFYTDQLREINNGLLSGMKNELAEVKYPGLYYGSLGYDEPYPLGESPNEFYKRRSNVLHEEIMGLKEENILIVTHGGVINILLHLYHGIPYSNKETKFPIKTGTVTEIVI